MRQSPPHSFNQVMAIAHIYVGIIVALAIAAVSNFKTFIAFFTTPIEAVGNVM